MINVTWEYEICGGDGIKYMVKWRCNLEYYHVTLKNKKKALNEGR